MNRIDVVATAAGAAPDSAVVTIRRSALAHTDTVGAKPTTTAQRAAAPALSSDPAAGCDDEVGPTFCLSGNGTRSFGTLVVAVTSTVTWTAGSPDFTFDGLNDDGSDIGISGSATSGTSVVDPGTYRETYAGVIGHDERFTIRIAPR